MKKFTTIAALSLVFISNQFLSQNSGFIGKKNIVSLDARVFMPLAYNFIHTRDLNRYKFKEKNGSLTSSRNLISQGLNLSLGRTLNNQLAFHVQLSMLDYKFIMEPIFANGTLENSSFRRASFFRSRAIGIMPIFEFTNSGGILPIGLTNQVGLGFYTHRPLQKDYQILLLQSPPDNIVDEENLFDYDNYRIKSYSLMYKINLRLAINRSLLFNVGIRYNLNITQLSLGLNNSSEQFGFTESDYREMIRKTQATSLVSLETGLSYVF